MQQGVLRQETLSPPRLFRQGRSIRTQKREKPTTKSSPTKSVKVFNDIDNRAKALDKKQRQISLEEKHGKGGEKMRKGGQQGENERQCSKKSKQEHDKTSVSTYHIFQHKMSQEVSHCSRAKQRQRNVQKGCCALARLFFFLLIERRSLTSRCHSSKIFGSDNKPDVT